MTPEQEDAREHLRRDERAYERGEHVDRAEAIDERRQRAREWDIAMGDWIE